MSNAGATNACGTAIVKHVEFPSTINENDINVSGGKREGRRRERKRARERKREKGKRNAPGLPDLFLQPGVRTDFLFYFPWESRGAHELLFLARRNGGWFEQSTHRCITPFSYRRWCAANGSQVHLLLRTIFRVICAICEPQLPSYLSLFVFYLIISEQSFFFCT